MNGVASDSVLASCPACSGAKHLGRSELGQQVTCRNCGTDFVVRERRRERTSHQLRTTALLRQCDPAAGIPPAASPRALKVVLALLLLTLLGMLVASNWDEIADGARRLPGLIDQRP
jgi:hypothetical protein